MQEQNHNLDQTLRQFARKTLDGQLGRAAEAFAREAGQSAPAPKKKRSVAWLWKLAAIEAAVVVLGIAAIVAWHNHRGGGNSPVPTDVAGHDAPAEMQQATWYRDIDGGPVMMADNQGHQVPARLIRRQFFDQRDYRDPKDQSVTSVTTPAQEEQIVVSQSTY